MPNPMRQKGDRFERAVVQSFHDSGIAAQRVPLSGGAGGLFSGDLWVEICGDTERLECKKRSRAWLDLYNWLDGAQGEGKPNKPNYALVIARDRYEPLVVLRLNDFKKLAKGIL